MSTLQNAIDAIRLIDNQADLNVLADEWKRQMSYIGSKAKRGLKKGDVVNWESRGVVRQGTIVKMNQKTVEVQDAGATPFGRTVTRIPASMITGKVAA
jgi:hypothetical protein|tara:strand:+ start:447 stop:740 length:294 start_codon:yes stop_codon:yes gene_type:complete